MDIIFIYHMPLNKTCDFALWFCIPRGWVGGIHLLVVRLFLFHLCTLSALLEPQRMKWKGQSRRASLAPPVCTVREALSLHV